MKENKKTNSKNHNHESEIINTTGYPDGRDSGYKDAIPGINTPGIELPAYNPPVPNRAWTAMTKGLRDDKLSVHEETVLENEIDGI